MGNFCRAGRAAGRSIRFDPSCARHPGCGTNHGRQVMAYGYARGGRRSEPDPRDVVEEAAHAAGLSVDEWLQQAAEMERAGRRDRTSRRLRPQRRRNGRDLDERGRFDEPDPQGRVERILDDALASMQDTIRANDARTARAIAELGRKLDADEPDNRVQAMRSDIERDFGRRSAEAQPAPAAPPALEVDPSPSLARHLEERISNVVNLIEQRSKASAAPSAAPSGGSAPEARDLRQPDRALERQIAALGDRIESLAAQVVADRATQRQAPDLTAPIERLQREMARLNGAQNPQPGEARLLETLRALDGKVGRLAAPAAANEKFDRLANEIAALRAGLGPQVRERDEGLLALERRFDSLGERLDAIADKVAGLKASGPRDLRAQRSADAALGELKSLIQQSAAPAADGRVLDAMRALERRLEAIERPPQALSETVDRVRSIESKLDAMQQRTPPELAARLDELDRLETLERKLDAMRGDPADIADRLDDIRRLVLERPQNAMRVPGVEAALETLSARVDKMRTGTADQDAVERLHAEFRLLSGKLEQAARSAAPADADAHLRIRAIEAKLDALSAAPVDLAAKLDDLQAMMQERPAAAAVPSGVETLLRNLALRLESMQAGPTDDRALDRLHRDIRQISQKLEQNPTALHAAGLAELGGLERSIGELFRQLETLRADVGATAHHAARIAADDVVSRLPQAPAPAPDDGVRRQLSDIQMAQQEAERRADATLGAVHETLKRVVDRLVDLEHDLKARPEPAVAPTPAPKPQAPHTAAAPMPAPSVTAAPLTAPPITAAPQFMTTAPLPALGAPPAGAASLRAHRLGVSAPAVSEPASMSGLGNMIAAARGAVSSLKLGKPASPAEASAPAPAAAEVPAQNRGTADMPLEPGSGRPRPGAATPAAMPATLEPNDPKANFLAAARRAAQTAADQSAQAMADAAPATKGKAKAKGAPRQGVSKKQAILLGLAALVVAIGATLQVMQTPGKDVQPEKTGGLDRLFSKPDSQSSAAPAAAIQRDAAAQSAPPRQILPPAPSAARTHDGAQPQKPEDRVSTLPPGAPLSLAPQSVSPTSAGGSPTVDTSTVGALAEPSRATEPTAGGAQLPPAAQPLPPASADPLLRFEGVTGAERLKTAARAGDVSAFIELGNRHLEGKGAPRDPKVAVAWFERAAAFGSAPAQFRLGAMHREGRGVERNAKVAIKHFQIAAEAGNARSMYNAAVLLAEGVNGSPDYAAAGEWFRKAAEFGIRDSQYNLAILYARGLGLPQDLVASYAWFAAAAANGDEDAAKKRDEVAARLEPAKLAQAKAAAAAWKPKTPDPASNEVPTPPGGWDQAASAAKQVPAAALAGAKVR